MTREEKCERPGQVRREERSEKFKRCSFIRNSGAEPHAAGAGVSQVGFTVHRRRFDGLDARNYLSQVGEGSVGTRDHLKESHAHIQSTAGVTGHPERKGMLADVAPGLGVVEFLLMSILQHFLHDAAPSPHVKHGLSVLVSHLLQQTPHLTC